MCFMMMHDMNHAGHDASATHSDAAHGGAAANESPLNILKRRYALGEIGQEQFAEMMRVLGTVDAAPSAATTLQHH